MKLAKSVLLLSVCLLLFRSSLAEPIRKRQSRQSTSVTTTDSGRESVTTPFRMRGEFEHQSALLLAGGMLSKTAPDTLAAIVASTENAVPVVLMANDFPELVNIRRALKSVSSEHCKIVLIPHDTVWVRDFGPFFIESATAQSRLVDFVYDFPSRPKDESVPTVLAKTFGTPLLPVDLCLPGGNLLTNGSGLAVTTDHLLSENQSNQPLEIEQVLAKELGFNKVVWLEPLVGERTGHVDMFATFTDARTIAVGELNRRKDPKNAAILDRNAQLLAETTVGGARLNVVRIPMPTKIGDHWRTYANVIFANRKLLVPRYKTSTRAELNKVRSIYEKLLPGRDIHFIDASSLFSAGGSLHCISLNLGALKLPGDELKPSQRTVASIP